MQKTHTLDDQLLTSQDTQLTKINTYKDLICFDGTTLIPAPQATQQAQHMIYGEGAPKIMQPVLTNQLDNVIVPVQTDIQSNYSKT